MREHNLFYMECILINEERYELHNIAVQGLSLAFYVGEYCTYIKKWL